MPTYEYACRDCGEHLEVVQSFKDDALTVCPSCDGQLRKVFSAAGLIFKGSGWHVKDYATSSRSPSEGGSKSSSDTSSPEASKPDASKPDSSKPGASKPGASSSGSKSSGGGSRATAAAASTEKKSA